MSIDYEEQYWTKFEEIVFNVTDTLKDSNGVITDENCNNINNALSISIKKVQELVKNDSSLSEDIEILTRSLQS